MNLYISLTNLQPYRDKRIPKRILFATRPTYDRIKQTQSAAAHMERGVRKSTF